MLRIPSRPTIGALIALALLATSGAAQRPDTTRRDTTPARPAITRETLRAALDLIGLTYSDSDLDLLLRPRGQFGNDFAGRGGGAGGRDRNPST